MVVKLKNFVVQVKKKILNFINHPSKTMVRFENLIYEQLLNIRLFSRSRQLTTPKKWYNEPRHESVAAATILLKVLLPVMN